ncbi:MAG: cofactor-independent phosphoglycerate mutase [Bacteroidaceae bacterium]|nr:cofactor-independent phosphoglycerate mutase [Bacteroidaceae bacterium]
MKHIIILGDGMADHKQESLNSLTPLQAANIPLIDQLAREGKTGRLVTVPEGFPPGSEVANTAILGYDLNTVYEGRGPLEAASIGYEMANDDLALRCNIISLKDGKIMTHHGGHLQTEDAHVLIDYLNDNLAGDYSIDGETFNVKFIKGIQYRHLLIIKGGNKNIICNPPHDHPNEEWEGLLVQPDTKASKADLMKAYATATLINLLIHSSQELLAAHPFNKQREAEGKLQANSIWPWSGGYRPSMDTLLSQFPEIKKGSVITAVDLIKGIGHYAGLDIIEVEGVTGLADTNYEGKAQAAVDALKNGDDFVFVHVEATDEAGHDGDVQLKVKATEYLNDRIVKPIYDYIMSVDENVAIAILPDHPTPCETRTHVNEPVPFIIWHKEIEADSVQEYSEEACVSGEYGLLKLRDFIETFMKA